VPKPVVNTRSMQWELNLNKLEIVNVLAL
jgi:hypothetical protein